MSVSYTPEEILLGEYVNHEINMGKTKITIPQQMLSNVRIRSTHYGYTFAKTISVDGIFNEVG